MIRMLLIDIHRSIEKGRVATVRNFPGQHRQHTANELRALGEQLLKAASALDAMNNGGMLRCVCGQIFDPGPPDRCGHIKELCPDCEKSINYMEMMGEWEDEKDLTEQYLEDESWLS